MREEAVLQTRDRDDRELEPLGAVQRHHQDARVARPLFLVDVRQQRQLIDEAGERRLGAARLVFASGRHQLGEVLDAAVRILAPLLAQVLQVAALIEHLSERDRDGLPGRHLGQRQDQVAKGGKRLRGARCEQPAIDRVDQARP